MCLDILNECDSDKVKSIFNKNYKGNRKQRPFSYNSLKDLFEANY